MKRRRGEANHPDQLDATRSASLRRPPSPCSSSPTLTPVPDSPLTPAPPTPDPDHSLGQILPGTTCIHDRDMPQRDRRTSAKRTSATPGNASAKKRKREGFSRSKAVVKIGPESAVKGTAGSCGDDAGDESVMKDGDQRCERAESEMTAGTIEVASTLEIIDVADEVELDTPPSKKSPSKKSPSKKRRRSKASSRAVRVSRLGAGHLSRLVPLPKTMLKTLYVPGDPVPVPLLAIQPGAQLSRPESCRSDGPELPSIRARSNAEPRADHTTSDQAAGGISSRKFARVLRIVAGLPPISGTHLTRSKYLGPLPRPPVWAESRQELCEALPYYRAFQSGLYMNSRIAYGYLLEAFGAPRDVWAHGGRVVISHGYAKRREMTSSHGSGGQSVRTTDSFGAKGNPVLAADQTASDSRVDTLLNAHRHRTPLILLAGEGYDALPFALNRAYVVLGWYWISAVWVEAEPADSLVQAKPSRDFFHRYKVRFDWVEAQGRPWWDTLAVEQPGHETICDPQISEVAPLAPTADALFAYSHGLLTPPTAGPLPRDAAPTTPKFLQCSPPTTPPSPSVPLATCRVGRQVSPGHKHLAALVTAVTRNPASQALCPRSQETCPTCDLVSDVIYQEGWICTKPDCPQFWLLSTRVGLFPIPPGFALTYNPGWLRPSPTPSDVGIPYSIRPPAPASNLTEVEGCAGDRTLWMGKLGVRRLRKSQLQVPVGSLEHCMSCDRRFAPLTGENPTTPLSLAGPVVPILGDAVVAENSGISSSIGRINNPLGTLIVHHLPEDGCSVLHFMMDDRSSADRLWKAYQAEATSGEATLFQRRAMAAHTSKGQLLSQQFAVNSGMKYKYIVDTLSLPFEDSPACVNEARELLINAVEATLGERIPFNEVLSVIYREGQKMSWHDDGEQDLGPIVASLSLGSPATMSWRAKGERNVANTGYFHGRQSVKPRSNPTTALTITLQHGDVMVMTGARLQSAYNHRVIPHGFRVAATARVISHAP